MKIKTDKEGVRVNNKMKSILGSVMIMAVVASLMSAGTMSYFSDEEVAEGTLTAGTIDIALDPDEPQTVTTIEGHTDLKPCQTGYIEVNVTNEGTNPLELWKKIDNIENLENGVMEPEQEYYDEYPESENYDLSDWVIYDLKVNEDQWIIGEGDGYYLTENATATEQPDWDGVEGYWIYLGQIPAGGWLVVNQSYHIHSEAENWAQSDIVEFDMVFLAQQIEGELPPEPDDVLPGFERPVP